MATPAKSAPRHPLNSLCKDWLSKITLGIKARNDRFGVYAQECEDFFDGANNCMWKEQYAKGPTGFMSKEGMMPMFQVQINKLFEALALFGPVLYSQNPHVMVTPLQHPEISPIALGFDPNDPIYQQMFIEEQIEREQKDACAQVKQAYLNWLQYESNKKTEARRVITEAIVAGLGVFEIGMYQPPFGEISYPKAKYLSWHDLVVDPDAVYWENVNWIAIRRIEARNKVEERFGFEPGDLKGQHQSVNSQATRQAKREANQNRDGVSFDQIEYWEIYSKNGMGDKLAGLNSDSSPRGFDFTEWGQHCYLVVAEGIPFPLNLPSNYLLEETDVEQLIARAQWPIPFWYDASADGGWPIVRVSFYESIRSVWPIGMFKPAIGELRFANWCLSFLADKVAQSCTTYLGILKAAGAEIQKQIGSGRMGPFTYVELSQIHGTKLSDMITFLQAPDFPQHIWAMLAQVLELIDKRTGLTELIYGLSGRQIRSATEANVRDSNISIRPDDMAQSVEAALSAVSVREMQAARWFCTAKDVQPSVGRMGAMVWENLVQRQSIGSVVLDYDYRIEAGSARKPNKQGKIDALNAMGQSFLGVAGTLAQGGIVGPFNAYMEDLAKAMDLDASRYLIELPPPGEQGPPPEQIAAQAKQAEVEIKQFSMQQELVHSEEKHDQEMRHDEEKFKADMKHDDAKAKQQVATAKAVAKAKPKPSTTGTKR